MAAKRPYRRRRQGSALMAVIVGIAVLLILIAALAAAVKFQPEQPKQPEQQPVSVSESSTPKLAEDDPSLWLTGDELAYALPEELEELVQERMELCRTWLTEEELQKLTPQQKYDVANQRKQEAERGSAAEEAIAADQRLEGIEDGLKAALLAKLAETDEAGWEDIFEQLKPANRTQLRVDATSALDASRDFDYLEGEARENVVLRMMVTPRQDWLALLRQILKEDAEEMQAAQTSVQASSSGASSSAESSSSSSAAESSGESLGESSSESESAALSSSSTASSSAGQSSSEEEDDDDSYDDDDDDGVQLKVYDLARGRTVTGSAFEIVSQVVQNEMGSFHTEALKAQAVAAYTFILFENNAGITPSLRLSAATSQVEKATRAVLGEALYYNGKPAFTPFFATSAGATNPSSDVWGGSYPYLISVDSSVDEDVKNFEYSKTMSESSVRSKLESYYSGIELDDDPEDWFEVLSYTEGGYNKKMRVGNKTTTARILRESVLSLRSAAFTWEYDGSSFVFTTRGYGHGVGMSQTGANEYAKMGWDYEEILDHYYPGTTLR